MTTLVIADPRLSEQVLARRRQMGLDRWDEKWDGVWHMGPTPDDEHMRFEAELLLIFKQVVEDSKAGIIRHEYNVADPVKGLEDYRVPDISVVLKGGRATRTKTYIAGGPDLVVEIHSPGDEAYEKLAWYAKQGVRDSLIVHRDTKRLELFGLQGTCLVLRAASPDQVESRVVPLRFERVERDGKPGLLITHTREPDRRWEIGPAEELP